MVCFVKEVLEETKSQVTPTDEDYVRVFMTVRGPGGGQPIPMLMQLRGVRHLARVVSRALARRRAAAAAAGHGRARA